MKSYVKQKRIVSVILSVLIAFSTLFISANAAEFDTEQKGNSEVSESNNATVYFDNANYNWKNVYLFVYSFKSDNSGVVVNADWPGLPMTYLKDDLYKYVIKKEMLENEAYVIFNSGLGGVQYPSNEGYVVNKSDSVIFNGNGLNAYTTSTKFLLGDADMNSYVNIKDATTIQKYIAELIDENDIDIEAACVTGKLPISIVDATYIQKYIAEIIDEFPAETNASKTTITFNVKIPYPLLDDAVIGIGSNLNNWEPDNKDWLMKKIDPLNYQLTVEVDNVNVGTTVEYKYTIQENNMSNAWEKVECSNESDFIANRTHMINEGSNILNDNVIKFLSQQPASTVTGGILDIFTLSMPQYSDGRTRKIRVWLPDGYNSSDKSKKYPVIYMHDGQNIFDAYTSFCGEWNVDETISGMIKKGYEGSIVVGIDNSSDRFNEYTPDWQNADSLYSPNPSGEKYAAFIVETLKPYIDSHYNVRTDKNSTAIGGSSMGGLISYYIGLKYPEIFSKALVFSPAYWVFEDSSVLNAISSFDFTDKDNLPKMYLYAGGKDDEAKYTRYISLVKNKMLECGYPEEKINTFTDISQTHNESAWAKYFPQAYKWLVDFK